MTTSGPLGPSPGEPPATGPESGDGESGNGALPEGSRFSGRTPDAAPDASWALDDDAELPPLSHDDEIFVITLLASLQRPAMPADVAARLASTLTNLPRIQTAAAAAATLTAGPTAGPTAEPTAGPTPSPAATPLPSSSVRLSRRRRSGMHATTGSAHPTTSGHAQRVPRLGWLATAAAVVVIGAVALPTVRAALSNDGSAPTTALASTAATEAMEPIAGDPLTTVLTASGITYTQGQLTGQVRSLLGDGNRTAAGTAAVTEPLPAGSAAASGPAASNFAVPTRSGTAILPVPPPPTATPSEADRATANPGSNSATGGTDPLGSNPAAAADGLRAPASPTAPSKRAGAAPPRDSAGSDKADSTMLSTDALNECVVGLAGPDVLPVAIDHGHFAGRDALLVVLPTPGDDRALDVWIVSMSCSARDPQVQFFARMPR